MTKRIAMWSGPRNLSTAMMYSFGARGDCKVVDEPFYAAYLAKTGLDHPMGDEIIASQPTDPVQVAADLMAPCDQPVFYQKHMTQHMIEGVPRDWMKDVTNVFLIRHPARVVASYAKKREKPTLEDIGFVQQLELFESCDNAVVVDAADIRANPEGVLQALCEAIDIDWTPNMLSWPSGGHADDGIWAAHWYGAVHRSTGFGGAEGEIPKLGPEFDQVVDAAMPIYDQMAALRLT